MLLSISAPLNVCGSIFSTQGIFMDSLRTSLPSSKSMVTLLPKIIYSWEIMSTGENSLSKWSSCYFASRSSTLTPSSSFVEITKTSQSIRATGSTINVHKFKFRRQQIQLQNLQIVLIVLGMDACVRSDQLKDNVHAWRHISFDRESLTDKQHQTSHQNSRRGPALWFIVVRPASIGERISTKRSNGLLALRKRCVLNIHEGFWFGFALQSSPGAGMLI